jgi:hypothetical protein
MADTVGIRRSRRRLVVLGVAAGLLAALIAALAVTSSRIESRPVVLVDYRRTGEVPGGPDRLLLHDDGVARLSRGGHTAALIVRARRVDAIERDLRSAGFERLRAEYPAPLGARGRGAGFSLTHAGRVVTVEPGAAPPPQLRPAVARLDALMDLYRRRNVPSAAR